jgi:uncharacterized protein YqhQ
VKGSKRFFGFGRNVFVSGMVSFFMDVSSEMIYPLVPLFLANVLGANNISPSATFYFGAITATLSAILFIIFAVAIKQRQ